MRGSYGSYSSKPGIVKNRSFATMSELTPAENSCICRRTYSRKASLDHLPRSIIVGTGRLVKHRAIVKLDLIECVPTSSPLKPSLHMLFTVCRIYCIM